MSSDVDTGLSSLYSPLFFLRFPGAKVRMASSRMLPATHVTWKRCFVRSAWRHDPIVYLLADGKVGPLILDDLIGHHDGAREPSTNPDTR